MGLDPVQDANQPTLLGETTEVHRVVVAVDPLDGEFDVQFHQRVTGSTNTQRELPISKDCELLL
jgi:hypothetical protein